MKRVFIGATSSAVVRAGLESLLATSPALTIVGGPQSHDKGERISGTPAEQIREAGGRPLPVDDVFPLGNRPTQDVLDHAEDVYHSRCPAQQVDQFVHDAVTTGF